MKQIVCITGDTGAGKTTVANYFIEIGFTYFSFIEVIKNNYLSQNFSLLPRNEVFAFTSDKRSKTSRDIFMQQIMNHSKFNNAEKIVIDGIRYIDEYIVLKTKIKAHTLLIGVVANLEIRLNRILMRKKVSDPKDAYEFMLNEEMEKDNSPFIYSQEVKKCLLHADEIIVNQEGLEELKKKIITTLYKHKFILSF